MKPNSVLMIFLSVLLFCQCKKAEVMVEEEVIVEVIVEEQESQEPDCRELVELFTIFGQPLYPQVYPFNIKPYFNPNNSDEILFIHFDLDNYSDMDLVKYNLKTEESQVLLQASIHSKPRWGKNGWILFTLKEGQNYNVYKIRDNGEDLTQLSTYPYCFSPMWDMESENIIYTLGYTSPFESLLVDTQGQILDTLFSGGGDKASWQHPIYMTSSNPNGLIIYNPYNATEYDWEYINERVEVLYEFNDSIGGTGVGAEWLDEERIVWCHTSGVFTTNIVTKETLKIRENCLANLLHLPTYAPDINKVIFERTRRIEEPEGSDSGYQISSFYMMNPDGTEGETLEIVLE